MTTARRYLALVLSGMLIAAVALTNTNPTAEAANTAPFTARFATNANGAILSFGNNLLTCPDSSVPYCERGRAGSPYDNNNFAMVNLDADNDPSTVNSSSSTLQLPDGATVLFAGLYWGARLDGGSSGSAGNAARADRFSLKVPGAGSYQTLTGQMIAQYTSQANAYQAFYDVTSLVSQAGNGQYWGANIQTGTGYDRYAGWAITVAYTAPGYPLRNLTVFDGFNVVGSGYPLTIQVSGFTAPRDGPVDAQLSMIAYEGDLSQTGDYTLLNQTQLATGVSPGSNFFNSINSAAGASVTTRTPAHRNMLGYDIKNLGASGVIPNSATSARFSFSSSGDVYYPGMLALAINLYAPDFASSTKSAVNLTSTDGAKPGDRMQYTLTYANTGQDPATNVRACDPLPDGLTYVPESLELLAAPGRSDTPVSLDKGGSSVGSVSGGNVCVYLGRGATNTAGGTLMVGDITSFRFEAIIGDDAGGTTLRNIAHLNYLTGTTRVTGLFDTPPADTPVARKADVSINKSLTPSAAIAGFPEKATLVVTNAGPNLATGVTVSDPLPTDFTVRRVTWEIVNPSGGPSGTCPAPAAGTPVVCQVPDLPSGRSVEVAIEGAMASSSTATTLSNVASVATTSFDPDLSNNVAAASVPMTRQADLAITKTASKDNPAPGEMITWTLTVTNQCKDGPESCMSDAVDVVLSDSVQDPSKMILTEVTGGDGSTPGQGDVPVTCPAPPDTPPAAALAPRGFTCRVATQDGRLRPGETAVVQATAYIMGNLGGGETIKNTATVTSATYDPIPSDNRDEASVETGEPTSRIKLTKEGPATVVAGGRADYTIKVENLGPSDATNVQVEDRLSSAGLTADAATRFWTDRGEPCGTAGPTVSCVLAALPGPGPGGGQGAVATVRITGALLEAGPPSPLETITNTAEVTCGGGCDEEPGTPSIVSNVATQADLSVTKTSNKSYVPPLGESVDYTVTVTNNGPSVAQDVVLKDTLPEGMTVQDVTPASGTCTTGTPLTCNFGPMSPESSITVTIKAKVDSTLAPGPITQTVRVESATDDPELGNNQATWTHVGEAAADLLLEKTSTGLAAGEPTTYTLKVTNNGPQDAHNLTITDTLPSDLTRDDAFAEANPLPNGCSINGQVVTCQVTTLDDGISQEFEIKVMVPPDVPDGTEIANTATVAATTEDPNPSNNTATEVDAVISETDLVVDYEIGYWINDPDDAQTLVTIPKTNQYTGPGSVRYAEIRVTNAGPAIAQGFQIRSNVATTAIPDQASFPGWCHSVNQELICSWLSDVAPGTVIRFNLPFIIGTDTAAATYADCGRMHSCADGPGGWASVTTSTRETHDDDNFDTAKLEIEEAQTELHMEKVALDTVRNEDGHPAYVAGGTFGYRLELWVPATYEEDEEIYWSWADAADVNLTDTLPEGFTVTQVNTSQGDCSITDPGVSCELGTVVASTDSAHPHKVTVYVYGTVDPDATGEISQMSGAVNTATAESTTKAPGGAATKVTAMAETDVVQHVDLSISKLPDSPVSYAGGMVGYTLTVLNAGPSAAADVKVTDTLPEGLKFNPELSSQACQLDSTDPTEQKVECALSANWSVEPGASESFRIVASTSPRDLRAEWCDGRPDEENITCPEVLPPEDLTEEHPRTLQNKAEVATSSTDTNMDDNSVKVPTVLDALADFAVTASVSTDTPSAGSTVTYTMNGVNLGPSTLDNPVVEARFPPGFVLVSVEQPFMDCQSSHTGEGLNAVYTLRCIGFETTPRRDSFLPGFTIPGTVTMYIPPNTPAGSYDAEAWVYSRNRVECPDATAGTCESDYSNNAVAATVNVVQAADTSIVKRLVTPIPVVIGQPVTYELTATNAGPSIAGDVTISDTVPAGLTYVSGQAVGGAACPLPERIDQLDTVRCQIGSLAPGESAVVSLTFRVDATFTGEVCNSAIVGSSALDYSADDNTGTTCSPTIPAATDVAVTITAPNAPVPVGAQATYTAVVENRGPWPTTGAVVTFTLPPGLTDVEVTAISRSDGAAMEPCVVTGRQAVCQVGDLATGGTAEYRITGTAVGQSGTSLMVEADVKHDLTDTDLTDDHAAAAVQLSAGGGTGTPTGPSSPGTPPGSPSTPPTSTPPAGGDTPPASPSDPPSGGDSGKGGGSDDDDDGIGGEDDDDGDGDGTGELAKSGANMSTPGVLAGLLILLGAALTLRRSAFH